MEAKNINLMIKHAPQTYSAGAYPDQEHTKAGEQ
jgi:hypothetical protein